MLCESSAYIGAIYERRGAVSRIDATIHPPFQFMSLGALSLVYQARLAIKSLY